MYWSMWIRAAGGIEGFTNLIQKRARGIAMMLPWLVIPLVGLWAVTQLLPPPFQFEITSPRLACMAVLLFTLLWYEVLMPQLSAWMIRRNDWLMEKKRLEAIELLKLKKSATRRCRNCLTAYRDQNPCGGRFMCSYCGHFSKRPVLELPVPPSMSNLSSGILRDLVSKSGNILNVKSWPDNSWICNGHNNLDNANLIGGFSQVKSVYWRNSEGVVCGMKDSCMTKKYYSSVVIFACKLLSSSLSNVWWVCGKIFRVSLSDGDVSENKQRRGNRLNRSGNGIDFQESKSDKARRKAEEKRQARLEKAQLAEEERKQREEVARLVEERRKLRDESEKDLVKRSCPVKESQKKEAEKKRQERKKERDRGSCKSNSDVEDLDRKIKENDQKKEPERKGDTDKRVGMDGGKDYNIEPVQSKGFTASNSRVNAGTRYLDRVKGTLFSSSKAFSKGRLFGGSDSSHTSVLKEKRFRASLGPFQNHANRKGISHPDNSVGCLSSNGSDGHIHKSVFLDPPSSTAPKKSWGQLFSRSSTVVPCPMSNVISRPHTKDPLESQRPLSGQPLAAQSFDNPLDFGLPSPFTLSAFPNVSISTSSGFQSATEHSSPLPGGSPQKLLPEEQELFEDPCYVPDPVSLLGPVSESLDNFQLDLGSGFGSSNRCERSFGLNSISVPCDVVRPSPIESPLPRVRVSDRHTNLSWHVNSHTSQNLNELGVDDSLSTNENGTWKMWDSPPLVHDGIIGGSLNWLLSDDLTNEENGHQSSLMTMGLLLSNNDPVFSGTNSPVKAISRNSRSGGGSLQEEVNQNEVTFGSNKNSTNSSPFDQSPVRSWPKNQWATYGSEEGFSRSSTTVVKPPVGGLYSNQDVESLWSVS